MSNEISKIPSMQELIQEDENSLKQNALTVILNQTPPENWLVNHPMISGYKYLPIERVEYLLTRIYNKWWVEVKQVQVLANSVVVTVRLWVTNPLTKVDEFQDGIGASPIQTDKGAGAMDWNAAKNDGVQKAAPSAESYAIKDAAEKFGKLFGKDTSRKLNIDYSSLLKHAKSLPEFNETHFVDAAKNGATIELIRKGYTLTKEMEDKFLEYVGAKK